MNEYNDRLILIKGKHLLSIHSSNQNDYGFVKANINIPWKCSYIKYFVSAIKTKANIMLTTTEDSIEYSINETGQPIHIPFEDRYAYNINELVKYLNQHQMDEGNNRIDPPPLTFEYNTNRTLSIKASKDITIKSVTHRGQLVTGLFHTTFPITLTANSSYVIKDAPIFDFANKLYLTSLQGNAVYSSIGDQEYTPSDIATINTMIIDNAPIIINFEQMSKPIKIKTNMDSLKYLEMRLVDFQYQPVILMSPLFVTLKIKPSYDPEVKDVTS